jgi:peptide/nickel transport system substrate-binding protein
VLHQNATFTAKPKAIRWRQPAAFAMDFRAEAWGGVSG